MGGLSEALLEGMANHKGREIEFSFAAVSRSEDGPAGLRSSGVYNIHNCCSRPNFHFPEVDLSLIEEGNFLRSGEYLPLDRDSFLAGNFPAGGERRARKLNGGASPAAQRQDN